MQASTPARESISGPGTAPTRESTLAAFIAMVAVWNCVTQAAIGAISTECLGTFVAQSFGSGAINTFSVR
jgi:hypothetical protein